MPPESISVYSSFSFLDFSPCFVIISIDDSDKGGGGKMTTVLIIAAVLVAIYSFAAVGYYYAFKNFPM